MTTGNGNVKQKQFYEAMTGMEGRLMKELKEIRKENSVAATQSEANSIVLEIHGEDIAANKKRTNIFTGVLALVTGIGTWFGVDW